MVLSQSSSSIATLFLGPVWGKKDLFSKNLYKESNQSLAGCNMLELKICLRYVPRFPKAAALDIQL